MLLGLDWEDVDLERRLIHVRHARGGRQRNVPLNPSLAPLVLDYVAVRGSDALGTLFVAVRGRRLTQTIMTTTIVRYAEAAGRLRSNRMPRAAS